MHTNLFYFGLATLCLGVIMLALFGWKRLASLFSQCLSAFLINVPPFAAMLIYLLLAAIVIGITRSGAQTSSAPGSTVYQPNFFMAISNYTALNCPSNSTVNFSPTTNQVITVRQNQGDGWLLSITTTNSVPGVCTVFFDANVDGLSNHWTTNSHPFIWTVNLPANGTATYYTNFGRDVVNNARQIFPSVISNSCAFGNPTVNYLEESHGNQ